MGDAFFSTLPGGLGNTAREAGFSQRVAVDSGLQRRTEDRAGIAKLCGYFRKNYDGKFQLVAVLNGCRDNTLAAVQRVSAEYGEVGAVVFEDPIGKGGALIEGLRLAALADVIGYVDAD